MNERSPGVLRVMLVLLIIGLLTVASLWALVPFIAGVIGGLIGFGVIGLFIGPVILAVSYASLSAWIGESRGAVIP